jgi:lipocalin
MPSDEVIASVVEEAEGRGYDTSRLIWVNQEKNVANLGDTR